MGVAENVVVDDEEEAEVVVVGVLELELEGGAPEVQKEGDGKACLAVVAVVIISALVDQDLVEASVS